METDKNSKECEISVKIWALEKRRIQWKREGVPDFVYCFEYSGLETFLLDKMLDTVLRIGAGTAILNVVQVLKSKS